MTTPPFPAAALAAARDAARAHLRIDGDEEDGVIEVLAASALALAEAFTGQATIERGWRAVLPADGAWQRLPASPVRLVEGVQALRTDGVGTPIPPGTHAIDIDREGTGWVRVAAGARIGRVQVHFVAGMAPDWSALPPPLAQGVVLMIAHLFQTREREAAPPAAIGALWRPWRRVRIGGATRCAP